MVRQPKIAVLLATFNGAKWVCQQINSILSQVNVELTIFIADDASTDKTVDLIKESYPGNPKIIVTPLLVKVGSASRNFQRLLCYSTYEEFDFISFADQDDIWDDNKLECAIECLVKNHAAGYSCAVKAFGNNESIQILRQSKKITEVDYFFEGAGQGCTFVFRRELLLLVRKTILTNQHLCHQIHYHDWLLYAIARSNNHTWFFDQKPHILYRQHAANDTGSKKSIAGIKLRLNKLRSGWYFNQVWLISNLLNCEVDKNQHASYLISRLFGSEKNSVSLSFYIKLFLFSRRKFLDRSIVVLAVLFGWNKNCFSDESSS